MAWKLAKRWDNCCPRKLSVFPGYLWLCGYAVHYRKSAVSRVASQVPVRDRRTVCRNRQKFFSTYLKLAVKTMDNLKERFEKSTGDMFFEWFNSQMMTRYTFKSRTGQAPDLIYAWDSREIPVEVTAAYHDDEHAKFLWDGARETNGKNAGWLGTNPHESLAREIESRINEKSKKRYGANTILLVRIPPCVTSVEKLEDLLKQQSFSVDSPFAGVYVVGRFPVTSTSSGGERVIPIKHLKNDDSSG